MKFAAKELVFKEVDLRLRIHNVQANFIFNDTQGYSEFWTANQSMDPTREIAGYKLVEQKP